jgi:hypothetical protein
VGQRVVGGTDLGDRAIDLRAGVPVTGGGLGQRAGCHAGMRGESFVGALRPAVGGWTGRNSSFSRRSAMASSSVS